MKEKHFRRSACLAMLVLFIGCSKDPVSSDETLPSEIEISVGSEGGSFKIDDNMIIIIPAGAVQSKTEIGVTRLVKEDWDGIFDDYSENSAEGLTGFRISPGGIHFNEWVTVHYTSLNSNPTSVPLTHAVNLVTKSHLIASSVAEMDHTNNWLKVSVSSGGAFFVEASYAWAQYAESDYTKAPYPATNFGSSQSDPSCRYGVIHVETYDSEVACTVQDCQIIESTVSVQFKNCPGMPIETATMRKASPSCEAEIEFSRISSTMSINDVMPIETQVKVGCHGVKDQTVFFHASGVGSVSPENRITNEQGIAASTLQSGEQEGIVTLVGNSNVRYPIREFIFNDVVVDAFYRIQEVQVSAEVLVEGRFKLNIHPFEMEIPPNNKTMIDVYINDQKEISLLTNQLVNLSVSGPGSLSSPAVTTDSYGTGEVEFTAGSSEGVATVTATAEVNYTDNEGNSRKVGLSEEVSIEIKGRPLEHWHGTLVMNLADDSDDPYMNKMVMTVSADIHYTVDPSVDKPDGLDNRNIEGKASVTVTTDPKTGAPRTRTNDQIRIVPFWDNIKPNDITSGVTGFSTGNNMVFWFTHADASIFFGPAILTADDCERVEYQGEYYDYCDERVYTFNVRFQQTSEYRGFGYGTFSFYHYPKLPDSLNESGNAGLGNLDEIYGTYTLLLKRVDIE